MAHAWRGKQRRFSLSVVLFAMFCVELNVFCNPFSPTLLVHLFKSSQPERRESCPAFADAVREDGRDDFGSCAYDEDEGPDDSLIRPTHDEPPELDDTVALIPAIKMPPGLLFHSGVAFVPELRGGSFGDLIERLAPERGGLSLHKLCRLRC